MTEDHSIGEAIWSMRQPPPVPHEEVMRRLRAGESGLPPVEISSARYFDILRKWRQRNGHELAPTGCGMICVRHTDDARAGDLAWARIKVERDGWLPADGRELSRVDYLDLFAAIGAAYGPGDGSTTFNLPDLRWGLFGKIGR